ncbi:MAG: DNA mismatch repair protein MutS [Clostridia bacterium]|nr:DNA mismatch repair protein MutS [Clostridia bacterium]
MSYTPMMQQYFGVKENYKDCILFYRLGDFYEMFFDDAETASKELELTLTGRDCGMEQRAPMCGVPYHSADGYITKLIEKGYKVAICEQMEDPASVKGIVKRDVIKVITPSTIITDGAVEQTKNNFLMSVYKKSGELGLSFADYSTGELYATVIDEEIYQNLITEISRFSPTEAVICTECENDLNIKKILASFDVYITYDKNGYFESPREKLAEKFGASGDVNFDDVSAPAVAGAIRYIEETQKTDISHISKIEYYSSGEYMNIDPNTKRNLEVAETMRNKAKKGSLLWVLDKTKTAMGGRQIRKWIDRPLRSCVLINKRLAGVEELMGDVMLRSEIMEMLSGVRDIQRLMGRIVAKSAGPKDLVSLKTSLQALPHIISRMSGVSSNILKDVASKMDGLEDVADLIERAIVDEPPMKIKDGEFIKKGYNETLDTLKDALTNSKSWLAKMEADEREKTGIKNLKIRFNKVFGYYIEVSNSHKDSVPETYIRKQTLTNGERYITAELKELEDMILGSSEKAISLEHELFEEVRAEITRHKDRIAASAAAIGTLDGLCSFAEISAKQNYCKPVVDTSGVIDIKQGRHPVVEKLSDEMFVPNDTLLNSADDRLLIITGPNMAGKSTYMRQVAVITLMAQIGCFVPAESARIGIVDSIFTRVGASDDLASGQSTFMVEMNEVAHILKHATKNSLIIYDEIGRGTSTYDGLAIAWSVLEYTADAKKCGAKTLFATHYHELTKLEETIPGVKNYCVAVKERGEDIIFLRKIIRGGADDSYGVEVARLAGIPDKVIKRAREILNNLESGKETLDAPKPKVQAAEISFEDQIALNLLEEIKKMSIDTLTPIEAMNFLYKIKKEIENI